MKELTEKQIMKKASNGDYSLHDSDTNDYVEADDLSITQEEYDALCVESMTTTHEGHVRTVFGRVVYAMED